MVPNILGEDFYSETEMNTLNVQSSHTLKTSPEHINDKGKRKKKKD